LSVNRCDFKNVNWGNLGKYFWLPYAKLSATERKAFLRKYKLQHRDVPQCNECKAIFVNCYCHNAEKVLLHATRRKEYQKSFFEKLEQSKALVQQLLKEHEGEKIFLAYSGGIDSECCLNLFKEAVMDGRITVIVADSLCDFPQSRQRWADAEKELGVKFVYARPDLGVSIKTIIQKVDWPIYPRGQGDPEKRKAAKECCNGLKKKNMKKIQKEANGTVIIMGLRGEENSNRRKKTIQYGDYFYSKSEKNWHVCPIAYWSIEDVWRYQEYAGFNYSKLYDLTNCGKKGFYLLPNGEYYQIRTGCTFCAQALEGGYLIWLEAFFPKYYDAMVNKLGLKNHVLWAKIEYRKRELKTKQYQICGAFN
jgi:3'-phosphoadenosine 5'-phosphosulfate sulfotransferase (PAPS reductase)/FAD synthetase